MNGLTFPYLNEQGLRLWCGLYPIILMNPEELNYGSFGLCQANHKNPILAVLTLQMTLHQSKHL